MADFDVTNLNDNKVLHLKENIPATIVGLTVDYLTRFMLGSDVKDAFRISISGASLAASLGYVSKKRVKKYINGVRGCLNDNAIISACKLATFDVWVRNFSDALNVKSGYKEINPDKATIENIRIMVKRGIAFFRQYGPITKDGFNFGPFGYTDTVCTGDGDFLTKDTLWEFKVLKRKPDSYCTLQLLMYWLMGQHSGNPIFKDISKVGIFNPRQNIVYTYEMSKVSEDIIKTVETDIIGYDDTSSNS